MLHWRAGYRTEADPNRCGYREWLAESGNRKYAISGCGDRCTTCDEWCLSLEIDGRHILDHEWWPTGRKACGDRHIRALREAQDVAQDWETAIVAYEIWQTGLWRAGA